MRSRGRKMMKGEVGLIEGNIPTKKNFMSKKIKDLVGLLSGGIAKEYTGSTSRSKFVSVGFRSKQREPKVLR